MMLKLFGPAGNFILSVFVDVSLIDVALVEVPMDEH